MVERLAGASGCPPDAPNGLPELMYSLAGENFFSIKWRQRDADGKAEKLLSMRDFMKKELSGRKMELRAGTLINQAAEERWQSYRRKAAQCLHGRLNLQSLKGSADFNQFQFNVNRTR